MMPNIPLNPQDEEMFRRFLMGGASPSLIDQSGALQQGNTPNWAMGAQTPPRVYMPTAMRGAAGGVTGDPNADTARWQAMAAAYSNQGGAPAPSFNDFMQRANQAQYGGMAQYLLPPQAGGVPLGPGQQTEADPMAWAKGPMWQYTQGGQGPFAGVPYQNWPDMADQLQASLPWAQLAQYGDKNAMEAEMQRRGMSLQEAQQAYTQMMGNRTANSGDQQRAFENWLATQQLGLSQNNQVADNSWRNRQLDLQGQQQAFTQDMTKRGFDADQTARAWQQLMSQNQFGASENQRGIDNSYRSQVFGANQAQQGVDNTYRNQVFGANQAQQGWANNFAQQQFGANRDDALWNRGFQDKSLAQNQGQFDARLGLDKDEQARQKANDAWSQSFQQAGFDWNKQQGAEQNRLAEQGQYLGAFGRKFGPNVGSM